MTAIERCPSCLGKKRLLMLGNIYKDCLACKGVGWISAKMPEPEKIIEEIAEVVKIDKRSKAYRASKKVEQLIG